MNDQPKSKSRWRIWRRMLISLAVLATLIATLVTEEDWRGQRDWENYRRAAEARGERFDWSAFAPTNLPDDENFVKAPIFSNLWSAEWDEQKQEWKPGSTNAVDPLKMSAYRRDGSSPPGVGGNWECARLTDLTNWQTYYRKAGGEFPVAAPAQSPAAEVLFALSKYDSAIEELRAASRRTFSRLGTYSASDAREFARMMEYLVRLKGCAQVLQLRAIAELDANQSTQALADVQLLLRLDDQLRQEPLLIEHLVSLAITAISLQPVYEGLAEHRWNDAQLAELERALAAKDFLADYQRAMRGERTFAIEALENERITREYKTVEVIGGKAKVATINLRLMPGAYFYQNELACARGIDEFLLPLVDVTNRTVSPTAVRQTEAEVRRQAKHYSPYKIQSLMTLPAVLKSVERFTFIQSGVNLARVACALERYRLARGSYPETLDALAPQFIGELPHDLINGQPLHYRRSNKGNFVLYSVGWNEKDDGGTVALTKGGQIDRDQGDWVWQYPAK